MGRPTRKVKKKKKNLNGTTCCLSVAEGFYFERKLPFLARGSCICTASYSVLTVKIKVTIPQRLNKCYSCSLIVLLCFPVFFLQLWFLLGRNTHLFFLPQSGLLSPTGVCLPLWDHLSMPKQKQKSKDVAHPHMRSSLHVMLVILLVLFPILWLEVKWGWVK